MFVPYMVQNVKINEIYSAKLILSLIIFFWCLLYQKHLFQISVTNFEHTIYVTIFFNIIHGQSVCHKLNVFVLVCSQCSLFPEVLFLHWETYLFVWCIAGFFLIHIFNSMLFINDFIAVIFYSKIIIFVQGEISLIFQTHLKKNLFLRWLH